MFKHNKFNSILGLLAIVTGLSGCVENRSNLVKTGFIHPEIVRTKNVYVSSLLVFDQQDEMQVSGRVRRDYLFGTPVWGHVDIAVVTAEGEVLDHVSTRYMPRRLSFLGISSLFKTSLTKPFEKDATVRAVFHNTTFKGYPSGHCKNNKAVPLS